MCIHICLIAFNFLYISSFICLEKQDDIRTTQVTFNFQAGKPVCIYLIVKLIKLISLSS